ncbi:MAG: N-acetyltransferase [Deltaproteobacteria bacterium]|nr:MAG: N-acetyltransferase [Deltaproteobacteria bacterium]
MLYLREANKGDMPLVLAWRNNPLIWQGTYTQRTPISWEEHKAWWESRQDHVSFMVVLVENNFSRDIGVIHISPLTYWSPEIGIIIGEVSLWNKGFGNEAFRQACVYLRDKGYKWTSTTVLNSNEPMKRILDKLGFNVTCEARKGEWRYALNL